MVLDIASDTTKMNGDQFKFKYTTQTGQEI